jgi:hypothetical protein
MLTGMTKSRRVLLLCSGAILALLAVVLVIVLGPRRLPVKFANLMDTPLKSVDVEFAGGLVKFETIAPRSTVFGSIASRSALGSKPVATQCPIVRLRFGDAEPLIFGMGERSFNIPVDELNLQIDNDYGSPRIHVEAIDRRLISYRYSSFHMKSSPSKLDDPR